MTIFYLAEAIDFRRKGAWSDEFTQAYTAMKFEMSHGVTFRPSHAWDIGSALDNTVSAREAGVLFDANRNALDRADIVVAVMPADQFSIGVPTEIGWATDQGQPVILVTEESVANGSIMVRGNPGIYVATTPEGVRAAFARALADVQGGQESTERGTEDAKQVLRYTSKGDARLQRFHDGDAAYDLLTSEDKVVRRGEYAMIPCGVNIEFPPGTFGWIVSRSSTFKKWGLHVLPGIIDTGFRGEMAVSCWRIPSFSDDTDFSYRIPKGTRLAQIVILPNLAAGMVTELVQELDAGDRGLKGWGSTNEPVV